VRKSVATGDTSVSPEAMDEVVDERRPFGGRKRGKLGKTGLVGQRVPKLDHIVVDPFTDSRVIIFITRNVPFPQIRGPSAGVTTKDAR
jgi:hypothetical protein